MEELVKYKKQTNVKNRLPGNKYENYMYLCGHQLVLISFIIIISGFSKQSRSYKHKVTVLPIHS